MNRLPPELLSFIISYLPANEILKCKQVNSEWRSIIDNNVRLKNLVITDQNLVFQKWSFTYQLVNCYDWIKQFYSIDDELIFKNLNQLYIEVNYFESKLSDQLNALTQLKRLEFVDSLIKEENFVLNLPNLTHLALIAVHFKHPISLNTPNLSHLRIENGLDNVIFNYPSSIKYLQLFSFDSKVLNFSNLEYLYCETIEDVVENFLVKLPKLKEIHYSKIDEFFGLNENERTVFESLKRQQNQLKRDLKVYYFGMNLANVSDVPLYLVDDFEKTYFICENYDKLAEIVPFMYSIVYDVLEDQFVSIPIDFTSKFVNIQIVTVDKKLTNKRQFIEFLKNYRNLKELSLKNSSLNQKFINILPDLFPILEVFETYDKKTIFDFEPILKLKHLTHFSTNQNLEDLDFVGNLFKKIYLKELCFKYHNKVLNLKSDSYEVKLETSKREMFVFKVHNNFHKKFEELERSNLWKNLITNIESDEKSDEEIHTDYESDNESIYKADGIRHNELNVINQFSSCVETDEEIETDYESDEEMNKDNESDEEMNKDNESDEEMNKDNESDDKTAEHSVG